MIKNRKTSIISNLTNGPGKLTQAMNITKEQNNIDLTKNSPVFITDGIKPKKILKNQESVLQRVQKNYGILAFKSNFV
jgi:DNA-3-methyladenine glycosylase